MQNNDREEFNALMRKIMGGYDTFPNPDKIEGYWTGLQKMTLPQLSRIIDHALSEEGPDKMPNVHGVWEIHREMRRVGSNGIAPVAEAPPGEKPVATVQEQLCAYAMNRLGLSPQEIANPWEYSHNEWWVDGKRNSTLVAVLIVRDTGVMTRMTVAEMYADTEGHARVMSMFKRIATPRTAERPSHRTGGLKQVGLLISETVAGPIVMADPIVSQPERAAAESFFDEPVTW